MLVGHVSSPGTYQHLLIKSCWSKALNFFQFHPLKAPAHGDRIEIAPGGLLYAIYQEYDELSAEGKRLEAHLQFAEFQGCLEGGEKILWCPTGELRSRSASYDQKTDVRLYDELPPNLNAIYLTPGMFVVFMPEEDLHMPGLPHGIRKGIKKLVIKVHRSLFE